jgi:hypothetical protein
MDANEMGTIQHHPINIQGLSYTAAMAIQHGSGEISTHIHFYFISF